MSHTARCSSMIIISILVYSISYAQGERVVNNLQKSSSFWNDGTIFLKDGNVLKGKIQYNDKNGTLSYKVDDNPESYSANTVTKFEFYDHSIETPRNFISLDYPLESILNDKVKAYTLASSKNNDEGNIPTFFEVLRETDQFAVLSKLKPIKYTQKSSRGGVGVNGVSVGVNVYYDEVKQSEILFILNSEGEVLPYIELISKERYNVTFNSNGRKATKRRNKNGDLLEEIFGEFYPTVENFIKTHKLRKTNREDFLKIIDHYISLKK